MLNVPSVWFLLNMVYSEAALILLAHNLSDYKTDGEGNGNLLQYSCLEKSYGPRSLAGYSPWGCKRVRHNLSTKHQQQWVLHLGSRGGQVTPDSFQVAPLCEAGDLLLRPQASAFHLGFSHRSHLKPSLFNHLMAFTLTYCS